MTRKMWKCLGNLAKWMKASDVVAFVAATATQPLLLLQLVVELDKSLGNVYAKSKTEMNS